MYYINTLKQELGTATPYEHNLLDERSVINRHRCHMAAKLGVFVDEDHSELPALYWLSKLHKRHYTCKRERSGSVVECLTRDRGAAGSSLTGVTALWSLSKTHLP